MAWQVERGVVPLWRGKWLKIATWSHQGLFSHCLAHQRGFGWLRALYIGSIVALSSWPRIERPLYHLNTCRHAIYIRSKSAPVFHPLHTLVAIRYMQNCYHDGALGVNSKQLAIFVVMIASYFWCHDHDWHDPDTPIYLILRSFAYRSPLEQVKEWLNSPYLRDLGWSDSRPATSHPTKISIAARP
jgi:hypothetical protein